MRRGCRAVPARGAAQPRVPPEVVEEVAAMRRPMPREDAVVLVWIPPKSCARHRPAGRRGLRRRAADGQPTTMATCASASHRRRERYVRLTPLDQEARALRAVRLPRRRSGFVAMRASSGLYSLVEGEDRLTKAIIITFTTDAPRRGGKRPNTHHPGRRRIPRLPARLRAHGLSTVSRVIRAADAAKHAVRRPHALSIGRRQGSFREIRTCIATSRAMASKLRAARAGKNSLDPWAPTGRSTATPGRLRRTRRADHNDESHQLIGGSCSRPAGPS